MKQTRQAWNSWTCRFDIVANEYTLHIDIHMQGHLSSFFPWRKIIFPKWNFSFPVYEMNKTVKKTTFSFICHCHQCFTTAKICLHVHVYIEQKLVPKTINGYRRKNVHSQPISKECFIFLWLFIQRAWKNRKQLDSSTHEKLSQS